MFRPGPLTVLLLVLLFFFFCQSFAAQVSLLSTPAGRQFRNRTEWKHVEKYHLDHPFFYNREPPSTVRQGMKDAANFTARTQDDANMTLFMQLLTSGLPLGNTARVGVVGAGISGLITAFLLIEAGYDVEILEASNRMGGRMKTDTDFSGNLHAESAAMRFPCSHYATHAAIREFNLTIRRFYTSNPQASVFLECLGKPFPRYALYNQSSPYYDATLLPRICDCFNVSNNECTEPGARFKLKIDPFLQITWEEIVSALDNLSTRQFLQSTAGDGSWSDAFIEMWAVLENQEPFLEIGMLEYARDHIGMFWDDACNYPLPNGPLYDGMPSTGLWELTDGASALPEAFYSSVRKNIRFGARVTALDYSSGTDVTVTYLTEDDAQENAETYDYVVVTVPFSILRHIQVSPPFSLAKRRALREIHYVNSVKVLLQFASRWWNISNPNIDPKYNHTGIPDGAPGGQGVADTPIRSTYFPSNFDDPDRGVLVGVYTWESDADFWSSMSDEQCITNTLAYLQQIYGPNVTLQFEFGKVYAWRNDKYAGGAYCYFLPGQQTRLFPGIIQSEPTNGTPLLFFAGEHASYAHSWVHGAITSALRATYWLHLVNNARVPTPAQPPPIYTVPPFSVQHPNGVLETVFCAPDTQTSVLNIPANTTSAAHQHPEDQTGYVIAGEVQAVIGGVSSVFSVGTMYYVPGNTFHSISATSQNATVAETFSPPKPVCKNATNIRLSTTVVNASASTHLKIVGSLSKFVEGKPGHAEHRLTADQIGFGFGYPSSSDADKVGNMIVINGVALLNQTGPTQNPEYHKLTNTDNVKTSAAFFLSTSAPKTTSVSFAVNASGNPFLQPPPSSWDTMLATVRGGYRNALCFHGTANFTFLHGVALSQAPSAGSALWNESNTVVLRDVSTVVVGCVDEVSSSTSKSYGGLFGTLPLSKATPMGRGTFRSFTSVAVLRSAMPSMARFSVENVQFVFQVVGYDSVPTGVDLAVFRLDGEKRSDSHTDRGLAWKVSTAFGAAAVVGAVCWCVWYRKRAERQRPQAAAGGLAGQNGPHVNYNAMNNALPQ